MPKSEAKHRKRKYKCPSLIRFGALHELTGGGGSNGMESQHPRFPDRCRGGNNKQRC